MNTQTNRRVFSGENALANVSLENKEIIFKKAHMLNKTIVLLVSGFVVSAGAVLADLEETKWMVQLVHSRHHGAEDVEGFAEAYVPTLTKSDLQKMRSLVDKVAKNGPEIDEGDYEAAGIAIRLLGFARAEGAIESAVPLLKSKNFRLRATAAEAIARAGGGLRR